MRLWAGGDEIGEDEIELLVAARADVPPFALTDSWGRREVAGVLAACETMLERSTRSGEIHMLVGRLVAHVRRVQACQRLQAPGEGPARLSRPPQSAPVSG